MGLQLHVEVLGPAVAAGDDLFGGAAVVALTVGALRRPARLHVAHGLQQIRAGSELTLAWVSSITGLRAHQVFMPAILMLSMLQIFALGAVSIFRGRFRKVTLLAFFLFATSPLFGLGTLADLLVQWLFGWCTGLWC